MARTLNTEPRSRLDRWLGPGLARFVAAISLAMAGLVAVVAFATERPGETAIGPPLGGDYGQFYAVGLAGGRRGHAAAAGAAFSLLLYKPTLLVLVLPLAVVGRRWRLLAGFLAGGAALAILSAVVAGPARCEEFVRLMATYARLGG